MKQEEQVKILVNEVHRCRNIYNNCDSEYEEVAYYELIAAELRLNEYLKEANKANAMQMY